MLFRAARRVGRQGPSFPRGSPRRALRRPRLALFPGNSLPKYRFDVCSHGPQWANNPIAQVPLGEPGLPQLRAETTMPMAFPCLARLALPPLPRRPPRPDPPGRAGSGPAADPGDAVGCLLALPALRYARPKVDVAPHFRRTGGCFAQTAKFFLYLFLNPSRLIGFLFLSQFHLE